MQPRLSRRRFLVISAAAGAFLGEPAVGGAAAPEVWTGTALGARASLRLHHPDRALARAAIGRAVAEVGRLERLFSLYRPDSALSALNREGALAAPPLDMVRLLGAAEEMHRLTGGVFDVTVQPLWRLYAAHFAAGGAATGPSEPAIASALARVGQEGITIEARRIALRPGMALTLNGIAQGYVTDRVTDLLRAEGFGDILVDMGEARGSGRHPDGRDWTAALARPEGGTWRRLPLRDRALATSAPSGFAFDPAGRFHHLLDPRTGRPAAAAHRSVSVLAPDATTADALSTAFAQMPAAAIEAVLARRPEVSAHLLAADGGQRSLSARA